MDKKQIEKVVDIAITIFRGFGKSFEEIAKLCFGDYMASLKRKSFSFYIDSFIRQ